MQAPIPTTKGVTAGYPSLSGREDRLGQAKARVRQKNGQIIKSRPRSGLLFSKIIYSKFHIDNTHFSVFLSNDREKSFTRVYHT